MTTGQPTLIVGMDGTTIANQALIWAIDHATRTGAAVEIVTVRSLSVPPPTGPTVLMDNRELAADIDAHQQILDAAIEAAKVRAPNLEVTGRLDNGVPGERLCERAEQADATMLVLGSHGRGPVLRTLLGSVASYCVQHASCPVLVIPAALDRTPAKA